MINGNGVGKLVPFVLELDTVKGMICLFELWRLIGLLALEQKIVKDVGSA